MAVDWTTLLPVGTYYQLTMGNDTRFGCRRPAFVYYQVIISLQCTRFLQTRTQALARGIISHYSDNARFCTQRDDVGKYIRRAAQMDRLSMDIHHGHRRLRGNAGDVAPDEFIQHYVAEHDNLPIVHRLNDFLSTLSC